MGTLIVHPKNKEQLTALKAFMKALRTSFNECKHYVFGGRVSVSDQDSESKEFIKYIRKFHSSLA